MFDELVQRVSPRLTKTYTHMRKALSPGLKIAITVRYLASGEKYPSLIYSFRVARNTICLLIPKVCEAIAEESIFCAIAQKFFISSYRRSKLKVVYVTTF